MGVVSEIFQPWLPGRADGETLKNNNPNFYMQMIGLEEKRYPPWN